MVNEKFALTALYDEPVFVVWSYWACLVKLSNIKCARLCTIRYENDLNARAKVSNLNITDRVEKPKQAMMLNKP